MKKVWFLAGLLVIGCSSSNEAAPAQTDDSFKAQVTQGMHDTIMVELTAWRKAVVDLQNAAPTPTGRGWDATMDAAAITQMKDAWRRCRIPYEHIEGAIAPLFPDRDASADARYDDFLVQLLGKGDDDPFDGKGVTGMHAIERILYAKEIPAKVTAFEKSLPGYADPAYPATEAAAAEFKTKLIGKLLEDIDAITGEWQSAGNIDLGTAFVGLVSLMNEQREKVNKAATGEEESRYAQMTMFDLRNNLEGTMKAYEVFRPWILSKSNGTALDAEIKQGFADLGTAYAKFMGDAVPQPPDSWSSDMPTAADLGTPFGQLFTTVRSAVDPTRSGSIVYDMNKVADLLGFPEFKVGK
ncbi:MAG: imelysin family protein [Polyangiales bacterium]